MKTSGSDIPMARQRARRAFTLIEPGDRGHHRSHGAGRCDAGAQPLGKARNLSRDRVEAYQRAATAIEAVRTDVASTLRSDDLFDCRFLLTQRNTRSRGYDRSASLLVFSSLRPIRTIEYQGEGLEYETAYRVEDDELGAALWRRRDPVPDDVPDGGGMAEPVADGIVGLRIEASKGDGAWMEEWDSDYDGLPKPGARVTVTATGAPLGGEATRMTPEVTLSTMVALDRVVPPKSEEPKDDGTRAATDGTVPQQRRCSRRWLVWRWWRQCGQSIGGWRRRDCARRSSHRRPGWRASRWWWPWRIGRQRFDATTRSRWRTHGRPPMSNRRGSVIVVVIWAVAIAAVLVAATQIVTFRQAVLGREALARVEARWAARAGLEQMISIMEYYHEYPNVDDPMAVVRDMESYASGQTESGSWDIRHYNDGVEWAGPRDEAAKLNINRANKAQLLTLDHMTPDVVDAIFDWKDSNNEVEGLGAERDYYDNRAAGYHPRNANFRSFAELELVAGAWPEYARGEDWNLNGRLDPNEDDGSRTPPDDKPDGKLDAGWSQYLTASSKQSKFSLSGQERLRLQSATLEDLINRTGVDEAQAKALQQFGRQSNVRVENLLVTPLSQVSGGTSGQQSQQGSSKGSSTRTAAPPAGGPAQAALGALATPAR